RLPFDPVVPTDEPAATLPLLAEQYREIPVFLSALDRQECFEQRIEDIQAARLQRLIARDVENAREFVAEPVTRVADHAGQAVGMAAGIAGSFIGGFARLSENAMEFFSDFFTGGSAPATRPPVQREAMPSPVREKTAIERAREYVRSVQPDVPRLDPQTVVTSETYSQLT